MFKYILSRYRIFSRPLILREVPLTKQKHFALLLMWTNLIKNTLDQVPNYSCDHPYSNDMDKMLNGTK